MDDKALPPDLDTSHLETRSDPDPDPDPDLCQIHWDVDTGKTGRVLTCGREPPVTCSKAGTEADDFDFSRSSQQPRRQPRRHGITRSSQQPHSQPRAAWNHPQLRCSHALTLGRRRITCVPPMVNAPRETPQRATC